MRACSSCAPSATTTPRSASRRTYPDRHPDSYAERPLGPTVRLAPYEALALIVTSPDTL